MIIVMKREATEAQIQAVIEKLVSADYDVHRSTGEERTILGVVGAKITNREAYAEMPGVEEVIRITKD